MSNEKFNFNITDPEEHFERIKRLDEERDVVRSRISETLQHYHDKLVASGKPDGYILSIADMLHALADADFLEVKPQDKIQTQALIERYYRTRSKNDVLAGIGLPHKKISEF